MGRESYKMEEQKSMQKEKTTNKGNMNKSTSQTPFQLKGPYQIKRIPHERTFSLQEPLPIVTTHFKIEVTYVYCNTIDTLYL
jgi:hypothetical protein